MEYNERNFNVYEKLNSKRLLKLRSHVNIKIMTLRLRIRL